MIEINELIEQAGAAITAIGVDPKPTPEGGRNLVELSKAISQLAIAKLMKEFHSLMNSKICLDCEGTGFGKPTEAGKNTHGLTIRKETHCPTCKGRGRVE